MIHVLEVLFTGVLGGVSVFLLGAPLWAAFAFGWLAYVVVLNIH